jgi:hypothetical protein
MLTILNRGSEQHVVGAASKNICAETIESVGNEVFYHLVGKHFIQLFRSTTVNLMSLLPISDLTFPAAEPD